eukprot:269564_1
MSIGIVITFVLCNIPIYLLQYRNKYIITNLFENTCSNLNLTIRSRINKMDNFIPKNISITTIDPYKFDKWIDNNELFKFITISNQTITNIKNCKSKSYDTHYDYTLNAKNNEKWLKCLHSKNVSSVLFIGDSEHRYIAHAIGEMFDKQNLVNNKTLNGYKNYIYFESNYNTGNIAFRYVALNTIIKENKMGRNNANLSSEFYMSVDYLTRQLRWQSLSNSVVLFNSGIWCLSDASDPMYFYQKYLPHYAEIFDYFLKIKYNATIIWRTTHWNYKHHNSNNLKDDEKYNLVREKMNIFANEMANEYKWKIIDDYSYSFERYDQLYDGLHYTSNSTVMNRTIMLFQRLSCLV